MLAVAREAVNPIVLYNRAPAGGAMQAERIERAYSHYAGIYDLVFDHILKPGRRAAVRALDPLPGERVLEIGIGTGLSLPYYPAHCHITGIDLSAPMLQEAEKKRRSEFPLHDVDLIQMDASRLEFPDGAFDRILASYVLSTVPDAATVLGEIVRVCRPGGRVVVVNHFRSSFPPAALVERILRPVTWLFGFRLDLPLQVVTTHPDIHVERAARTNLLGLWRLLSCRVAGR